MIMGKWVSAFHVAHAKFFPFNDVTERTVRIVFPNNVRAEGARIRIGNPYGETEAAAENITICCCTKEGKLLGVPADITWNGSASVKLAQGETLVSDKADFTALPGQYIAVSLYFPEQAPLKSGANTGKYAIRSVKGDFTKSKDMPADIISVPMGEGLPNYDPEQPAPLFQSVDLFTEDDVKVISVAGDSITAQSLWFTPFVERLYQAYPGRVVCGNAGVSGNHMLVDSPAMYDRAFGDALLKRLDWDVLPVAGLSHCVFAIGTNDIGNPGSVLPEAELPSVDVMLDGYRNLVGRVKKQGVYATGVLIFPRRDSMMNEDKENLRQEVNRRILEGNTFDCVQNLESDLREEGSCLIQEKYALADGLHINEAGGRLVAEKLDLEGILGLKRD